VENQLTASHWEEQEMNKFALVIFAAAFSVGIAVSQDGAKQDMKDAGSATKEAGKDVGHATTKGAKTTAHATATGAKAAGHATASAGKSVGNTTKNTTKKIFHKDSKPSDAGTAPVDTKTTAQ
jgi:hypothetical protein